MNKLELKHLAPYLPYKLKVNEISKGHFTCDGDLVGELELTPLNIQRFIGKKPYRVISQKPILRPLSELTEENWKNEVLGYYADLDIDISIYNSGNDNKNDFGLSITYKLMGEVFTDLLINRGRTKETPYHFFNWLIENHFDVFGLIEKGLAIDINTLNS